MKRLHGGTRVALRMRDEVATAADEVPNHFSEESYKMSVLNLLTQQLGGSAVTDISRQLGSNQKATENAMAAALPMLMGALARNASKPDGARALHDALSRDHDGSVLENLSGFLQKPDEQAGNGILRHVLGNKRNTVEAGVAKASGMDAGSVSKMMAMLAPLVMGTLGRTQRAGNMDATALAGVLANERKEVEKSNPALGGLSRLLDRDGDGDVTDDIANLGKGLLGGLFNRR